MSNLFCRGRKATAFFLFPAYYTSVYYLREKIHKFNLYRKNAKRKNASEIAKNMRRNAKNTAKNAKNIT